MTCTMAAALKGRPREPVCCSLGSLRPPILPPGSAPASGAPVAVLCAVCEQRAEEARAVADQMQTETRAAMGRLALSYERLAAHAAQRERGRGNAQAEQNRRGAG